MFQFKKGLQLFVVLLISVNAVAQSLYDESRFTALHADKRAQFVGDSITLLVYQAVQANSSAGEGSRGDFRFSGGATVDERNWDGSVNLGSTSSGDAATNREGFVRAQLTAVIVATESSGLLHIEGKQTITVNEEKQTITVKGTIRPEDISAQNTVPSFRVQNAEIAINGSGEVTSGKNGNVFTRFIEWLGF